MNRNHRKLVSATVVAALAAVCAGSALAQRSLPPTGMFLGSTIEDRLRGRDRDRDRDRNSRGPAYNPNFTHGARILPGYGYYGCDDPVFVINNSAVYMPGYYAGINGYGSYGYSTGGFRAGFQVGGLSLGYQQSNGGYYNGYGVVPNGNGYVREVIREYVPVQPGSDQERYDVRVRPETREAPNRSAGKSDGENDYYLHRKLSSPVTKDPGLADAIRNIEAAFRSGNLSSLERHVDRSSKLWLQIKGSTRQEMAAEDYLAMTRDALRVMKTARYELTKVEPASNGAVMVTGTHALKTEDGLQKTFLVGFILKQKGDTWIITEVSAEPAK